MPEFRPHNVLVTGGAGFIGSNFIRHLLGKDAGVHVVNLDKLTYAGSLDNLRDLTNPAAHVFVQGDICDGTLVGRILREHGVDTVVHFAAESHVDRSISGPAEFVQTNLVGTFVLLEACRNLWLDELGWDGGRCRFHHISTDEVYGTLGPDDPPFSETTPYAPSSPYSASKAGSDHLARSYLHTYGLPVTISNCSNNYGPYQHREKLIPTIIRCCVQQRDIPIYGDGTNIRDWLYVDDHCDAIDLVIRRGETGQAYNIGGNNEWSNNEIARRICGIMDRLIPQQAPHERLIRYVEDRPGHDWRYAIDGRKLAAELDWHADRSFDEGLEATCRWYLENDGQDPSRGGSD